MKIDHKILRAVKAPQPGKIYGARVAGVSLRSMSVGIEWIIFARKPRSKKTSKAKAQPGRKALS